MTRGYRTNATPTGLDVLLSSLPVPRYIVAARAGIHPSVLSQYALGKQRISTKHIMALCEVLQVPQEQIIGYAEPQSQRTPDDG